MVKQLMIYHKAQQAQLKESNMSNNIYNILGKLNALTESAEPAAPQATVYETVEPRGSITEAVRSLESKYAKFKESKSKPDFLDVDGDGDKAEPFKKAVNDKKAGGKDKSADKGMSAKQAKYFGKKKVSEGMGMSDELAAKKIAAKIQGTPDLNVAKIKQHVNKYLTMVGKQPSDVDHLAALVNSQLQDKGLAEDANKSEIFYGAITHPDGEGEELQYKFQVKNGKPVVVGCEDDRYWDECQADVEKYHHQMTEGAGPYTLDDPKHPKFKANYEKYKKAHPDCKLADFVAAMRKKEKGLSEGMDDLTDLDAYQFAEPDKDSAVKPASAKQAAADRRRRLQDLEDRRAEKNDSYSGIKSNVRKVAGKAYGGSAQKDDSVDEATTATGGEVTKVGNVTTHKGKKYGGAETNSNAKEELGRKNIWDLKRPGKPVDLGDPDDYELDEIAPPGAKAERMVKGIKKGYSQDGNLSKKEKGIAYATAYKAKKAGNLDEATKFGDKIANSKAELKKAKPAMVKESRVMEETDYFYEKIGKALCSKNPNLDTSTSDFAMAVRKEMVAQGMEPNRARGILLMDEDFLGDVATSYGDHCKEMQAETNGAPINSHLGGMSELDEYTDTMTQAHIPSPSSKRPITKELDEIARLAGLPVEETDIMDEESEIYDTVNHEEVEDTMDEAVLDELSHDDEELAEDDVAEGNEFSGALKAARDKGEKEFEVDGKRYTVKEDINVSVTANGQEDALNLFRKLAGMDEVAANPGVTTIAMPQDLESALAQGIIEPMEEERDIEYSNTPNEKIAPISASIPSGDDMHKSKKSYSDRPYRGDNPMSVKEDAEDSLWKKYSGMLKSMILK